VIEVDPVAELNAPKDGRSRPTLSEPIEWRLWKNRQRRDAVVVSLSTFEDRNLISVRLYTTSQDGKMLPKAKGVSLVVARLPELATAIARALAKAKELNLLPHDGGEA
jgi:Transcriptional Coactivator p15 (PC4)